MPEPEGVSRALREPLLQTFPAALLGRIVTIPYYPLSDKVIELIIRLQLKRIQKRIQESHEIPFTYNDEVVDLIRSRCTEVESGGEFLTRTLNGEEVSKLNVTAAESQFVYQFE